MCRKNQLIGIFLVGLGIGLVVACRVSSIFWCSCLGFGAVLFGIAMLQRIRA